VTFGLRSLHSVTGVLPTGLFMLVELWTHAKALHGPDAHRAAVEGMTAGLWLQVSIGLPMAFHAGYGVVLALRARYTVGRYPSSANWNYTLQRVTGLLAFLFIGLHLATFWWPLRAGWVPETSLGTCDTWVSSPGQLWVLSAQDADGGQGSRQVRPESPAQPEDEKPHKRSSGLKYSAR